VTFPPPQTVLQPESVCLRFSSRMKRGFLLRAIASQLVFFFLIWSRGSWVPPSPLFFFLGAEANSWRWHRILFYDSFPPGRPLRFQVFFFHRQERCVFPRGIFRQHFNAPFAPHGRAFFSPEGITDFRTPRVLEWYYVRFMLFSRTATFFRIKWIVERPARVWGFSRRAVSGVQSQSFFYVRRSFFRPENTVVVKRIYIFSIFLQLPRWYRAAFIDPFFFSSPRAVE